MTPDELVPLYGFVQGDTLGLLVLVRSDDTVQKLISTLQEAAQVRVPPVAGASVHFDNRRLALELTISAVGLTALARVDLVREGGA